MLAVDQLRQKISELELSREETCKQLVAIDAALAKYRKRCDIVSMLGDDTDLINSLIDVPVVKSLHLLHDIPDSMDSVGSRGQFTTDSTFLYVCVQDNTWRRAPLVAWNNKC